MAALPEELPPAPLALALGERGEASVVRQGAERADISAEFEIGKGSALQEWLAEQELTGDDGRCLLRRVIDAGGRSRAFINGCAATLAHPAGSLRSTARFGLTSPWSARCCPPMCVRPLPRVVPRLRRLRCTNAASIAMTSLGSLSFCHWLLKPRDFTRPTSTNSCAGLP